MFGGVSGGGGGNGFSAPDLFPGNGSAYGDLVGSDLTAKSAGLTQDDGVTPFLLNGGTGSEFFQFDAGAGPNGINAAKETFTSGGEGGAQCNWRAPSSHKSLFAAMCYKTSVISGNTVKMFRFRAADGTIINTPALDGGAGLISRFDQWGGSPWDSGAHLTVGSWDHVEYQCDITSGTHCIQRTWLNGTLVLEEDEDFHASSPDPATFSLQGAQWNGTMNTIVTSGIARLACFAISTTRIGVPAGITVPS